jgi:hypothetical protein
MAFFPLPKREEVHRRLAERPKVSVSQNGHVRLVVRIAAVVGHPSRPVLGLNSDRKWSDATCQLEAPILGTPRNLVAGHHGFDVDKYPTR